MNQSELFVRFAVASASAFGVGLSGLGLLLFGPKGWACRGVIVAAGVGAAGGVTALLTPQFAGWVFGVGAGLAAVLVALGVGAVQRRVGNIVRLVSRPRVAGGFMLLAALAGWGASALGFDRSTDEIVDRGLQLTYDTSGPLETLPADVPAATDRGTPLVVTVPTDPVSAAEAATLEANSSAVANYADHLIRRGPAGDESNCHGWVFTGGRFNLGGRYVPAILDENGYQPVSRPASGDLCVYYNTPGGEVAHTAIVRATLDDGTVLVEGKWGRMGVYLHPTTESCYGQTFTFYHTARGSHLLRGLDPSASAPAVTASSSP